VQFLTLKCDRALNKEEKGDKQLLLLSNTTHLYTQNVLFMEITGAIAVFDHT